MNTLTEIANKWETDKGTRFKNDHNYCKYYDKLLNHLIDKQPNILEIGIKAPRGIGSYPSLNTWDEYFKNAKIHGIDILIDLKESVKESNIHLSQVNQASKDELTNYRDSIDFEFDLILDDASHYALHQSISFICLFDKLKSGGIYIIEDLSGDFTQASVEEIYTEKSLLQRMIEGTDYFGNNISECISEFSSVDLVKDKKISRQLKLIFSEQEISSVLDDIDSVELYQGNSIRGDRIEYGEYDDMNGSFVVITKKKEEENE